VKIDEGHDLALIAADVQDAHYPSLRIAPEEIPLYGRLYMMGSPDGIYGSATQGFLIRKDFITPVKVEGKLVTHTFWLVEGAMLVPGISGGTGVDKHGDLQCVPAAGGIPQIGMCVGLADIKNFLKGISL
jgi:S1-C subfamily serine protease